MEPTQKMVGGGVFRSVFQSLVKVDPGFAVPLLLMQAQAVQKGRLPVGGILIQDFLQPDPGRSGGSRSQQVQNRPQITAKGRGGAFRGLVERFSGARRARIGFLVASENEHHHSKGQHFPFGRGAIT